MKKILYLTFYYQPDLCAGSFRNSPLIEELSKQAGEDVQIDVITTFPNRYSSFEVEAIATERVGNLSVRRIEVPKHQSGFVDQIKTFKKFYDDALQFTKGESYDLVIASSSRLFTAYLGKRIARKNKAPLYLDIRDIFVDTINDVISNPVLKAGALPILRYVESSTFNAASHINLISPGFEDYFKKYKKAKYSFFTNGIDQIFIDAPKEIRNETKPFTIVYAGNLGEGQGLHKFVPEAASRLGSDYQFKIIGDGGAKAKLVEELERVEVSNVELLPPISRKELLEEYKNASFLLMHLNDFDAFKKVLPSKVFELATYPQPMIAGVGGYANRFVRENVQNAILFNPGDVDSFVQQMNDYTYKMEMRDSFIEGYKRYNINTAMAKSMLEYLS